MDDFTTHHATPMTSIKVFCLQCMGYQKKEVPLCTAPKCPLFPYKLGKRPPKTSISIKFTKSLEFTRRTTSKLRVGEQP